MASDAQSQSPEAQQKTQDAPKLPANVTALPSSAERAEKAAQSAAAQGQKDEAKEPQQPAATNSASSSAQGADQDKTETAPQAKQEQPQKAPKPASSVKAKKTASARKAAKSITAKATKKSVKKAAASQKAATRTMNETAKKAAKATSFTAFSMPKMPNMEEIFKQSMSFATNPTMETMMNQSTAQFDKMTQEAAVMGRENMDAFMKFGALFAKGFEELSRAAIAMTQSAAEKQAELAKTALSSKTINEFAETQSKMAQASFDDFVQNTTKISEMSVKLMTEAAEPLNAQMNKAMNKANKKMAA